MLNTRCDHKVLRLVLLHDQPHTLNIVLCITPVTKRIHISKLQMILKPLRNTSRSQSDLTGNKVFSTTLRFMIKQNSIYGKHAISITVLLHHPETILLRNRIWGIWMKRRCLTLRNLLHLAVQLRGRSLINLAGLCQPTDADSLQNTQNTKCIYITRIFRCIKRHLHMTLCRKIINLIRSDLIHKTNQTRRIREITVMQDNRILLDQMINTGSV